MASGAGRALLHDPDGVAVIAEREGRFAAPRPIAPPRLLDRL